MKHINQNIKNTSKSNKEIILEIFEAGISKYSANLKLCKKVFSEESVHDLRVSIRRMITIDRVMNKIIPNDNVSSVISYLKSQIKIFNPLRDTQVIMIKIQEMIQIHPTLEIFDSELKERENNYILSLKKQIQNLSFPRIKPAFEELNELFNVSNVSDRIISALIINCINSSFTKVIELNDIASSDNRRSLHKVRLAFKKLRYQIEAFSKIINYPENRRKDIGKFQDILGAIQDNSVLMKNIKEFSVDKHLEKDFSSSIIEINKEGNLLVNNYFNNSNCLFDFWSLPEPPVFLRTK